MAAGSGGVTGRELLDFETLLTWWELRRQGTPTGDGKTVAEFLGDVNANTQIENGALGEFLTHLFRSADSETSEMWNSFIATVIRENGAVPEEVLVWLRDSPRLLTHDRNFLLSHPCLSEETFTTWYREDRANFTCCPDFHWKFGNYAVWRLIENSRTPEWVLTDLAGHGNMDVLAEIVTNPHTSGNVLENVVPQMWKETQKMLKSSSRRHWEHKNPESTHITRGGWLGLDVLVELTNNKNVSGKVLDDASKWDRWRMRQRLLAPKKYGVPEAYVLMCRNIADHPHSSAAAKKRVRKFASIPAQKNS